jgi:hypothetical protein
MSVTTPRDTGAHVRTPRGEGSLIMVREDTAHVALDTPGMCVCCGEWQSRPIAFVPVAEVERL